MSDKLISAEALKTAIRRLPMRTVVQRRILDNGRIEDHVDTGYSHDELMNCINTLPEADTTKEVQQ